MPANPVQELLPFVQMPSRYLGTEIHSTRKDPSTVALNVALGFPDLYEIGSSHFGIQVLYHILNQRKDIIAERVFAPDRDFEALLRRHKIPLMSLESQRPLKHFDLIGISLLYELNYTNVLNMLDLAGLHLSADQRGEDDPFVIAGGPCVCNPEPMAEFFDAMVFGDAEYLIVELAEQWLQWNNSGEKKVDLLRRWSRLEGIYVPRFFKAVDDSRGYQYLRAEKNVRPSVKRRVVSDLDSAPFPDSPVIPFGRPVHDRLRLEISRGCSRGCRFCQAGMIYRPVRERKPATLLEMARKGLAATGYEDISLLSLSTGDYRCLGPLMEMLMRRCRRDHVAVSLPSLRAGVLTPRLMELIRSVRKTGFTIAPEAGSQRLRDVINKNITYEDVAQTVEDAFAMGWRLIKLYFMIGLPTETDDDLDAIVAMVRDLLRIKGPNGHKGHINVSVTTFIPKSHTPFQWAGQIPLDVSKAKIARLKSAFDAMRTVRFKWQDPGMSLIEGILARGDRRTSEALVNAWKNGCIFDGWTDRFDLSRWMDALTRTRIPIEFYTSRERSLDEPLPWDHMDSRVDSDFLKGQWASAQVGECVTDCRHGECHACGVCDFEQRLPRIHESCAHVPLAGPDEPDCQFLTYELTYEKVDAARFFGHLEMMRHFGRAMRRAGIEVKYSEGYHPMPKIAFDNPLPLGVESESEIMRITVAAHHGETDLIDRINPFLPSGLQILTCRLKPSGRAMRTAGQDCYRVSLSGPALDPLQIDAFNRSERWDYTRIRHSGRTQHFDLKTAVVRLTMLDETTIDIVIRDDCKPKARPADILQSVFKLKAALLQSARVRKLNPHSESASVDN